MKLYSEPEIREMLHSIIKREFGYSMFDMNNKSYVKTLMEKFLGDPKTEMTMGQYEKFQAFQEALKPKEKVK